EVEDEETVPHNSSHNRRSSSGLDVDEEQLSDDSDIQEVSAAAVAVSNNEAKAEAELERLKKRWNASIYAFFKLTPTIEYSKDGDTIHVFECKAPNCRGRSKFVRRNLGTSDATSTGNLKKHAVLCWGKEVVEAAGDAKSVHEAREVLDGLDQKKTTHERSLVLEFERIGKGKVRYSTRPPSKMEIRAGHVRWMAVSKRSFSLAEDEGYHFLMKTGRPEHYIPSYRTISRDICKVFLHCWEKIARVLQEHNGMLNLATDAWTSPNHRALVAVTVHLEKKGTETGLLLDIIEVAESHTGRALAAAFAKIVEDFGIAEKVLSITCDNASANDRMIDELPTLLTEFSGETSRTRCFAHIINLVAKSIITQFDLPKRKRHHNDEHEVEGLEDELQDLDSLAGDIDFEEREEHLEIQRAEGEGDNEDGWVDEQLLPACRVLTKLCKVSFAIKNSSTKLLPHWRSICKEQGLAEHVMPRDVRTRWNSTYDMLAFAVDYQVVLDKITDERSSNLQDYELDKKEWRLAGELRDILSIFKDATLFFSRDTVPNLTMVIPAMDHIDEVLAMYIASPKYSQAIWSALSVGKCTLNRYYSKTDFSETYRIAMVLHPRYKLAYFRQTNWPEEWIKTAETMVRTNYDRKYKHITEDTAPLEINENDMNAATTLKSSKSLNIFDNLPAFALPTTDLTVDEVTRYLQTETVMHETDPLRWWYERQHLYPGLSRMAQDYLSIPAMSVDVERIFSGGRMLLSYL
ncbi:hypothetical protein M378DRAFT_18219, partial [Amanita muscaria Koide BX008]